MALSGALHVSGQRLALLPTLTITTAISATATTPVIRLSGVSYLAVQAALVYGSGGTNVNVYVQTSLDSGLSWIDIMNFSFTTATATKVSAVSKYIALAAAITPSDGSLTANTIVNGLLGDRLRLKYVTTGTYAGTTLTVDGVTKG